MRDLDAFRRASASTSAAVAPLDWMADAACQWVDPELFFPQDDSANNARIEKAKAVCGHCDVRAECLAYAEENGDYYGVWGGLSERDRRKLNNGRAAA